jgi:hypothetical protein
VLKNYEEAPWFEHATNVSYKLTTQVQGHVMKNAGCKGKIESRVIMWDIHAIIMSVLRSRVSLACGVD